MSYKPQSNFHSNKSQQNKVQNNPKNKYENKSKGLVEINQGDLKQAGDLSSFKLAIITSRFNAEVTGKLLAGAKERCAELGIKNLMIIHVPGAVEIPLIAQEIAVSQEYDAIIALGAVIRGETSHYDYVCDQVSQGCQKVMMDFAVPVIFGVLTTENDDQARERIGGKHGHKGRDAVDAACEMICILNHEHFPMAAGE